MSIGTAQITLGTLRAQVSAPRAQMSSPEADLSSGEAEECVGELLPVVAIIVPHDVKAAKSQVASHQREVTSQGVRAQLPFAHPRFARTAPQQP